MAYQNINQYVYNKWYLTPVREISDLSLASDERDYNEEVIFSPYVIGVDNGDIMPIKIDLNFSGSNQGFILDYQNYNDQNILVSSHYYNPFDLDLSCYSAKTICDIGLVGTDNGLLECMTGQSIDYTMGLLDDSEKFDRLKYDRRFKMFQVTGYTWDPNHRFSGVSAGTLYNVISYNSNKVGIYHELYGGFYQGFYKLFGYDYEVLPTRYPKGWTVEMTLKPRFIDQYTPASGQTTLNDYYPDNSGIFFYMGTRAENKFWHHADGKNSTDPNYERVTHELTGLSTCMCTNLNPGYSTSTLSKVDMSSSGATITVAKNLSWTTGDQILLYHDALNYLIGTVTTYDIITGELHFVITERVGRGEFSYWIVDKVDYLKYAEQYCVLVYPPTGYTDYHQVSTTCSCCNKDVKKEWPEHDPLFDSMSNALAIRFSGDPRNPKICVRTLTFTGDCIYSGSCVTLGPETVTGYSVNNYCSTNGIYDDCLGTDYINKEHWVLVDAVFERYTWMDFCDLYYRGGLGTISTDLYTATTANNSVSLIEPPTTHEQLVPEKDEWVELNYLWLLERFYRVGKLKLYVNGKHFETFDDFEEIIPRPLYAHKEVQVGVPFNISWGGGTQGLHENLVFSAMPQTFCGEYIQDPELFPDNILSGTSLSALTTNIMLEKYFAGTFDGGISTFHMYAKPLSVPEIQHNARVLQPVYDLLNPYCLDCEVIDDCDCEYEYIPASPTPTPSVTPSVTPSISVSPTPSVTPSSSPGAGLLRADINPGSVEVDYVFTLNRPIAENLSFTFTNTLGYPGEDIVISSGFTVNSGTTVTFEQFSISGKSFDELTRTSELSVSGVNPSNVTIEVTSIFASVTPTPSISISSTPTPSVTPSITPTPSISISSTPTPSVTPSVTSTPSISISSTPSITVSPSLSATPSTSSTPSPSVTPSVTPSISISTTPSISISATPSISISATPSVTPSVSATPPSSVTATPTSSVTPSVSPSVTPSISVTPSVTASVTASVTPSTSVTPSVTPSVTSSVTPSVSLSATPSISISSTPSSTPSISISATPSISVSSTPSPTPSISISVTPSITVSISVSPTPSISLTPSTSTLLECDIQVTLLPTPSISVSPTPSISVSPTISVTPSISVSPTISITPSISVSITPSPTQAVIPSDPTLEIYYQGSLATYYTPTPNSGDTFTQWVDSSSSAHNANAICGSCKPEWWSNQQNGLGGTYYDGISMGSSVNPLTDLASKSGETIIVVARVLNTATTEQYIQGGQDGNTGLNSVYLRQSGGTYNVAEAGGLGVVSGTPVDINPHIFSIVFSGSGTSNADRLKFRIDSVEQTMTFPSNVGTTTSSLTNYIFMGVSYTPQAAGTEQYYYNGFLFDVLVYSRALSPSELDAIESYLSNKWNIPLL